MNPQELNELCSKHGITIWNNYGVSSPGKNIENFAKELFDIAYLKGVADAEVKVQGDY